MPKRTRPKIRKKGLPPGSLVYTGDRTVQPPAVRSMWYNHEAHYIEEGYRPLSQSVLDKIQWVDIRTLGDTSLIEQVGKDFQIHPLALEDVLNTQQRAKLEEYENGLFIVLHNLKWLPETHEIQSEQIAVFLGQNCVISFQEDPDDTLASVHTRAAEGLGRLRKKGADYLAYTIIDTIVDNYYSLLDEVDTELQGLEHILHTEGATQQCKAGIFHLKGNVSQIRHRLLPLRDALNRFYHLDNPLIDESNRLYLRDVADHTAQVLDSIDNYREMVAGAEALYQAEASNRLNNVMRLLTVISTIFIPLSFIAGVYGMNFDNMPELHWQYGYYAILAFMLSILGTMMVYFYRKGWL